MSMGTMPGQASAGLNNQQLGNAPTVNNAMGGDDNNNIGQVYQDMGQNYQQFGQAYQQATQAADQLKNSYSVNQEQMNQYLTALQGALGGMNTANMNTGGNNPGFGTPGTNTTPGMAFGTAVFSPQQQQMISGQNQPTLSINQAGGLPGAMNPLDYYRQYSNVVFGQPGSAYTPNFQG